MLCDSAAYGDDVAWASAIGACAVLPPDSPAGSSLRPLACMPVFFIGESIMQLIDFSFFGGFTHRLHEHEHEQDQQQLLSE